MAEEGSMADNVAKGRGIVDKEPFKTVGIDKADRETGGQVEPAKGRGRPPQDKNWRQVGPEADQESR
jgi:hypothetical protein